MLCDFYTFLPIALTCCYCSCAPVQKDHPVILVLCGERVVRYANVYIYEEKAKVKMMKTNEHGTFTADFLDHRHHHKLNIVINDACELPTRVTCNLPYHHYPIPLTKFYHHGSKHHILDLADEKYDRIKILDCL